LPYLILKNFSHTPEKKEWDYRKVLGQIKELRRIITLPKRIEEFLSKADKGELEVQVQGFRDASERIYRLGYQLILTLFIVTGMICFLVLRVNDRFIENWIALAWTILFGRLLLCSYIKGNTHVPCVTQTKMKIVTQAFLPVILRLEA